MLFKTRSLITAIAAISCVGVTHAAGLDRSTQPSWAFTEQGTFAYVEHITIDPKIGGKDNNGNAVPDMATNYNFLNYGAKADVNDTVTLGAFFDQPWGADVEFEGTNHFTGGAVQTANGLIQKAGIANVNDLASANSFITTSTQQLAAAQVQLDQAKSQIAAGQAQVNQAKAALAANPALASSLQPKITAGEEQLAAATQQLQAGEQQFNANKAKLASFKQLTAVAANTATDKGPTKVNISSQNFTGLIGVKFGEKKNIQVYAGPTLQKVEGEVHLRGDAYGPVAGYDGYIPTTTATGWMAGMAYTKPEIALKAAVTYRSEIEHDARMAEKLPLASFASGGALPSEQMNDLTIKTPQSVNVDFQTGLNPTTLLTAKVRWVPWSDFQLTPALYNSVSKLSKDANGNVAYPNGLPLVSYDKDSWAAELGLAKRFNSKFAATASVGWDSGAGNPAPSLGPMEGYWNVGVGAKYNLTPEWAISGGAKYLMFGDAKAKLPNGTVVGDFTDNDGMVYGVRLSYQKK